MTEEVAIRLVPVGQHAGLTDTQARQFLRQFAFVPSTGYPLWAEHRRASLSDGSSLHMVRSRGRWTIHRDRFDPHSDPVSAVTHMVAEAPMETLINAALIYFGLTAAGKVLDAAGGLG